MFCLFLSSVADIAAIWRKFWQNFGIMSYSTKVRLCVYCLNCYWGKKLAEMGLYSVKKANKGLDALFCREICSMNVILRVNYQVCPYPAPLGG